VSAPPDTQQRILRIFREVLNIELASPSTDIIATGLLDSLTLVTLLFEVEQEFAIKLPLEGLDIEGLRSVDRIAAVVARTVSADGSRPGA